MKKKTKKQNWEVGDLIAIPIADESRVLGLILSKQPEALNSVVCAFTLVHVETRPSTDQFEVSDVVAIRFVTRDLLDIGEWEVIGKAEVFDIQSMFDLDSHLKRRFVGTRVNGSGVIRNFLSACLGLVPWDMYFDPFEFDGILLRPELKPKKLIYK